jgi:predicted choloylglycine hydrolase
MVSEARIEVRQTLIEIRKKSNFDYRVSINDSNIATDNRTSSSQNSIGKAKEAGSDKDEGI